MEDEEPLTAPLSEQKMRDYLHNPDHAPFGHSNSTGVLASRTIDVMTQTSVIDSHHSHSRRSVDREYESDSGMRSRSSSAESSPKKKRVPVRTKKKPVATESVGVGDDSVDEDGDEARRKKKNLKTEKSAPHKRSSDNVSNLDVVDVQPKPRDLRKDTAV